MEIREETTASSPTFEIHELKLTIEPYRNIGQTAFKLKATILVREPEFQNKSYFLVFYEKILGSYAYVTVERGKGKLEIYELSSGSKLANATGAEQAQLSLIGYLELKPGALLISD